MGLDLVVGVLPDLHENDPAACDRFRFRFGLLNIYLQRAGLPRHVEPEDCPVWSCRMPGYSGLHYLRRIAAHLASAGALPPPGGEDAAHDSVLQNYYTAANGEKSAFDHLILHHDDDGLYLPLDFDHLLTPDPGLEIEGGPIGSAPALLRECQRLADVLKIPPQLDENSDELLKAVRAQGSGTLTWQQYGIESFSCVCLIQACRKSLATGAAVVFT